MFCCSVCQKIENFFLSGLIKHIAAHVKASYRFKHPLLCLQSNCSGRYADLESCIVHVERNHIEVRLTDNFDQANQVNSPLGHLDSYIDPDVEMEARPVELESYSKNIQSLLFTFF